jgi:hypothetical protein
MSEEQSEGEQEKGGGHGEGERLPSSVLLSKLQALREAIREVDQEIRAREILSEGFLEALTGEADVVRRLLARLGEPWSKGYLPAFEELRTALTRELFNLTNRERSERLRMWEDIAALRKQRREYLLEYQALKKTAELLEEPSGSDEV